MGKGLILFLMLAFSVGCLDLGALRAGRDDGKEDSSDLSTQIARDLGGASRQCSDEMEWTQSLSGVGYWIDRHEVSNRDYAAFLAAPIGVEQSIASCTWNDDLRPRPVWPLPADLDDYPVVGVDWCDAFTFCRWAGKRLCGKIGGAALAASDFTNIDESQWFNSCSQAGTRTYPYGSLYVATACNGKELGTGSTMPVCALADCRGDSGVFDLSGSVWEWEDACEGKIGARDLCRRRGGSWKESQNGLSCASDSLLARNGQNDHVGFRCCKD